MSHQSAVIVFACSSSSIHELVACVMVRTKLFTLVQSLTWMFTTDVS
jgi:hypothetical protein